MSGCGCGDGLLNIGGESSGCGCGCGDTDTAPKTREQEIEQLVSTWQAIQRRLAELRGESPDEVPSHPQRVPAG